MECVELLSEFGTVWTVSFSVFNLSFCPLGKGKRSLIQQFVDLVRKSWY